MNKIVEDSYFGSECYPKSSIVKALVWEDGKNVKVCEQFLKDYEDYKFEYNSGSWILRWRSSYKTLHEGDVLIIGYRAVLVLKEEEFKKTFSGIY